MEQTATCGSPNADEGTKELGVYLGKQMYQNHEQELKDSDLILEAPSFQPISISTHLYKTITSFQTPQNGILGFILIRVQVGNHSGSYWAYTQT